MGLARMAEASRGHWSKGSFVPTCRSSLWGFAQDEGENGMCPPRGHSGLRPSSLPCSRPTSVFRGTSSLLLLPPTASNPDSVSLTRVFPPRNERPAWVLTDSPLFQQGLLWPAFSNVFQPLTPKKSQLPYIQLRRCLLFRILMQGQIREASGLPSQ